MKMYASKIPALACFRDVIRCIATYTPVRSHIVGGDKALIILNLIVYWCLQDIYVIYEACFQENRQFVQRES